MPHVRDRLIEANLANADHQQELIWRATKVGRQDYADRFIGMRDQQREEARLLEGAQLFWASEAMRNLALDASQDMPEVIRWADILPAPHGVFGMEKPLPAVPLIDGEGGDAWTIDGGRVHGDARPTVISWSHIMVQGRGTVRVALWVRTDTLSGRISRTDWAEIIGITPTVEEPLHTLGGPDWATGVLAFLATACTLMQQPKVVLARPIDPTTGGTPRGSAQTDRLVTLIDLRPLQSIREEPSERPGREYKHRWVVRGHWTHQPVGEKRGQRRLTWISSYIKGPEGAPIIRSEKVNVWRR
jgi:hypothetical protein